MNRIHMVYVIDKDRNNAIVHFQPCLNNESAVEYNNSLKTHPKYKLPCYEIVIDEITIYSSVK